MFNLILKNLKGSARLFAILAPLMMLVEVLMDLQQPTLMSQIIDIGVANRDLTFVWNTGLKMILFAILGFIGGSSCSIFSSLAAINMSGRMRQGVFDKIQDLSFIEIDHFKTSSLITRLTNDVMQMQQMLLMMLRIMVRSPLMFLGSIIMSYMLAPKLSIIYLVILPVVFVSIALVLKKSSPLYSGMQNRLDKVNTVMRENLLGVRVVKSFNLEKTQSESFRGVNEDFTEMSIQAQSMTFILMPLVTLVMNLSVVALLWFGGGMVMVGGLEIGKIMAFINYLVQITHSLIMVAHLMTIISRAQASAVRINEVISTIPSIQEPGETEEPKNYDIEFQHVTFRYSKSGESVLDNLSFSIRQGETVGIIGATGSGKSSLISMIPRLYDPTEGRVLLGGVDIRRISLEQLRNKIGVVMQDSILFSGTIRSNMLFGNEAASETDMDRASADAEAAEFVHGRDLGYDSPVEQRARNFSGGQKQRLSIARTLVKNPQILILDDSTSAVDLSTEVRLRTAIAKRMEGKTVIVIAQRISAVMNADRIFVLEHGRIAASGTHQDLLQTSDIYRNIVLSQLGEEAINYGRA